MNLSSRRVEIPVGSPESSMLKNSVICAADRRVEIGKEVKNSIRDAKRRNQAKFRIDWLQMTFPEGSLKKVNQLVQSVTGQNFLPVKVPAEQAYRRGEESQGIKIYSQNRFGKKTFCLVIPGSSSPTNLVHLLPHFLALSGRMTRLDFAFDDHAGITSLPTVIDTWESGNVVTRYKEMQCITSYERTPGSKRSSLFIGSRTSDTSIRVYEKQYEDELKFTGGEYEEYEGAAGYYSQDHYVRWELEVKNKTAHSFATNILSNGTGDFDAILAGDLPNEGLVKRFKEKALELLTSRLSFRLVEPEKNVSRAQDVEWWQRFVEYLDPEDNELPTDASARSCEDEDAPELMLDILDYDEAQPGVTERRRRERKEWEKGQSLVFELAKKFKTGAGDYSPFTHNRNEYQPALQVICNTRKIQRSAKPPAHLTLVGGTVLNELKCTHQKSSHDDGLTSQRYDPG